MNWFGTDWGAPYCQPDRHTDTPVGRACLWCDEPIQEGDRGVRSPSQEGDTAWHLNCFLRSVVGSVGHQNGQCSCHGGNVEDPPEMSLREAADEAVALFQRRHRQIEKGKASG